MISNTKISFAVKGIMKKRQRAHEGQTFACSRPLGGKPGRG